MTEPIVSGALTMGYFVAGLFFLRFWSGTRDRLFLFFTASFWLLALQRVALATLGEAFEDRSGFYIVRLLAYILILVAIFDKNRTRTPSV